MQLERSDSSDLAAVNAFLDEWEAVGESPAPAAAKTSRTRVRPQQELSRLRSEQRALASSLAQLRRAAQQAVERDDERGRGLSLAFWERAAARQAQRRVEAERENRRLRDQLQALARHSRRLQRALDRPALAPQETGPGLSRLAMAAPVDNEAVFRRLAADADAVFVGLDFSAFQLSAEEGPTTHVKRGNDKSLVIEHDRTSILPFELRDAHQALWGSLGSNLRQFSPNSRRTAVEYSGDTVHTSASVVIQSEFRFFLQMQMVARKYKTNTCAVVISKSIITPRGNDRGTALGAVFTETNVRVLSQVESDNANPLTCISTRATLSREVLGGPFAQYWGRPEDEDATCVGWSRALDSRDRNFEELLLKA